MSLKFQPAPEVSEKDLAEFVIIDEALKTHEAEAEYLKHKRRKLEDSLLEQFGENHQTHALIELKSETFRVYTRRTSGLRVTSQEVAEHTLRQNHLEAFIDTRIDTAKLGSFYKKQEKAGQPLPDLEGLDFVDNYKLYVIRRAK